MALGRNDPCSCGSGKKYKQCCLGKAILASSHAVVQTPTHAETDPLIELFHARQFAEAENRARKLLLHYPDSGDLWKIIGTALQMQGKDALSALQKSAELSPNDADAHYNLAVVQKQRGLLPDAISSYLRVIQLKPRYADAHFNLGNAFKELGQLEQAAASYRRFLELAPQDAGGHHNLGVVLRDIGQFDRAVASYRHALQLKPDYAEAHGNLGNALCDLGQIDSALSSYRRALQIKPDLLESLSGLLFALNYTTTLDPSGCLEEARNFGRVVTRKAAAPFSAWHCDSRPAHLRVGIISGDLCRHPVGYFLASLLAHIDPARIELIAYPTAPLIDALTTRLQTYFAAWKPLIGLSDAAAAQLIHADGVHVLLDLSGHTAHNRLPVFAWKPAPAQATWLGLPVTTGMDEMDFILGDLQAIPLENEHHFSERVWRLPESYLCFSAPDEPVGIAPLPALSSDHITFGSFNNLAKMTDAVVAVWARILLSVPGSRLYLKAKQLSSADICKQTRQRFASRGIAPERLILGSQTGSMAGHLDEYNKIDIALDTFPYPGVTTSLDALWMGVPVLSLHGDRFMSLTATTIAHHAGLVDWVAADQDDYVAKATAYASDLERLTALRATLREQVLASPLFDAPRFARNFEDALWGMWQDKTRHSATTATQNQAA